MCGYVRYINTHSFIHSFKSTTCPQFRKRKRNLEILEVTSAFNNSLVMCSFFGFGLSRIPWHALTMEETIG